MPSLDEIAESIAASSAMRERIKEALISAEVRLKGCGAKFDEVRSKVQRVQADVGHFTEKFEAIMPKATQVQDGGRALLMALQEIPQQWSQQLDDGENRLSELSQGMEEGLAGAGSAIQEALESSSETLKEEVSGHLESVQELITEIVEGFDEKAESLLEQVTEWRESADELAKELFEEALPDGVSEKAEAFMEGAKALKKTGIEQLAELTGSVGVIQDKTRALTDLVEQVKPVLEIAKQIL